MTRPFRLILFMAGASGLCAVLDPQDSFGIIALRSLLLVMVALAIVPEETE